VIPRRSHGPVAERPRASAGRRLVLSAVVAAVLALGLYLGLPRIAGLDETWGRLARGDPWWLAAAALLEAGSYGGYVVLFRGVFVRPGLQLGWRESYAITMAGVAATRVFAAGGAGGIALTAWAMARSGLGRRELVRSLTTFYVTLYSVYATALVVVGLGLRTGLFEGPAPFGVTLVPAAFGAVVIAGALTTALLPRDLDRRVAGYLGDGRLAALARALAAAADTVAQGVRGALAMLRARDPALLGALAWWAFDIAVLWACFHAFGEPPPTAVIVMAYFIGTLGNLLPLPGGVGGVDGGMIAAFLAFDVPGGLAVVAVLTYRAFAFWLPTIPGLIAYLQLRRTVRDWSRPGP
jgi:putative heme transporter